MKAPFLYKWAEAIVTGSTKRMSYATAVLMSAETPVGLNTT